MRVSSNIIIIVTVIVSLFLLPLLPDTLSITTSRGESPISDFLWGTGITVGINKYIGIFAIPFIMFLFHVLLKIVVRLEQKHISHSISDKTRRSSYSNLYSIRLFAMLVIAGYQFYFLFKNIYM